MSDLTKMPPQAIDLEAELLCGVLISEGETLNQIGHRLQPEDFYSTHHQILYRVLKEMQTKKIPITLASLKEELEKGGDLEKVGGIDYLMELEEGFSAIKRINYHVNTIKEKASRRRMLESGHKLLKELEENGNGSVAQIIEELARQVTTGEDSSNVVSVTDAVSCLYEKLEKMHRDGKVAGIRTGFKDLDDFFWGFHPGKFYVLAGRPSMGKSALAWNFIRHVVVGQKIPTLVYPLEVDIEQCIINLVIQEGHLDSWRFQEARLREHDWVKLTQIANKLHGLNLYFSETSSLFEICTLTRSMKEQKDIGFVVVDYIGLISTDKAETRQLEVANISRTLKKLAKELNIPILAVSQLNRGVEHREDKRPVMSDLRESGAIEQDADVVMLMYREDYYDPDSPAKGTAEVIIGKNRSGPTGIVKLAFMKEYLRFEDLANKAHIAREVV